MHDVIIIGAGPAGLTASLTLSRFRRSHLVTSIPEIYRSRKALKMHGFLTRDGMSPLEFMKQARAELNEYGFASFVDRRVVSATKVGKLFEVKLEDGIQYTGRTLIIAAGLNDILPPIEGPLCGIIGAPLLQPRGSRPRSRRNGKKLRLLKAGGVTIMPFKYIVKISKDSPDDVVIHLSDGSQHRVGWIVFESGTFSRAAMLAVQLRLQVNLPSTGIKVGDWQETTVRGVFAAGDCVSMSKHVPAAVSDGFIAGEGVHLQLTMEDLEEAASNVTESRCIKATI